MSKVTVTESYLSETAEAIRGKLGTDVPYTPAQFAAAIGSIPTGSTAVMVSKTITANGTYDPGDDNADGYDSVVVNVPGGSSGPLTYLTPYAENVTSGYVSGGTWHYSTSYTRLNTTVFLVEAGKSYLFLCGEAHERMRAMFTTVDITTATADVSGTTIVNIDNANAYEACSYTATANGFVAIYVGGREKKVYGFEGSLP